MLGGKVTDFCHGLSRPWLDISRSKSFLGNGERLLNSFAPQTSLEDKLLLAPPCITPVLQNANDGSHTECHSLNHVSFDWLITEIQFLLERFMWLFQNLY